MARRRSARAFKANQDSELSELAWLYNMNRSIYMTPGGAEEWTLSVTHDDTAVDAYGAVFEAMAAELSGRGGSFCVAAELTR